MSELKITKEKVLAAAEKCSTAKATLEILFPEAFKGVFDERNIYAMKSESDLYKLSRVNANEYAWASIDNSISYADGIKSANEHLTARKHFVFNNQKDFAKWILENA